MARKPLRRKPKQVRSGETYMVIVEAAAHVLLKHGYAKATTNRIAARAGVSIGSLYQYFDSKDAVFVAIMENYIEQLANAVQRMPLPESASFVKKLELIAAAGIRARPEGPRLMFLLSHTSSSQYRDILDQGKNDVAAFLAQLVIKQTQTVDKEKLDLRLQIAMDAVEGLMFNAASKLPVETFARELASLIGPYLPTSACEPAD
ncbi:MAG: TetR/AcrR family transcriptional regulator [Pseudomonadota bacterium]